MIEAGNIKPKIILCLTLVLGGGLFGCMTVRHEETTQTGPGPYFSKNSSFNGRRLLIDDTLWDVASGKKLPHPPVSPAFVTATRFSPDGRQALTTTARAWAPEMTRPGPVVLWDAATGAEIRRFEPKGEFYDFQFSPDGKRLLMVLDGVQDSDSIQIWDVNSGRRLLGVPGLSKPASGPPAVHYVSFSPDGGRLVVLSFRTVTVWNSFTGKQICAMEPKKETASPDFFVSTRFSPDGKLVLAEQCDGVTRVWDAATGRQIQAFEAAKHADQYSPCALFTADGRGVISSAANETAILWDVGSGKTIRRFQIPGLGRGLVDQMILSRDGKRLLAICEFSEKGVVRTCTSLLDVASGRLLRKFEDPGAHAVGFSPMDETFITTRAGKPDELWDGATGKIIRRYDSSTTADDLHNPGHVLLSGETLYGTASGGYGGLFKVNTDGTGFALLHGFSATRSAAFTNADGTAPQALSASGDTLYGVAQGGGTSGCGTVFKVKTNGRDFTMLHSFNGGDGASPGAGLTVSGRTLFGTTRQGGTASNGTVFRINTDGSGFAKLHDFAAVSVNVYPYTNIDGRLPATQLVASGQALYGTAWGGGAGGCGTIFRVNTNGTGFAVLHHFASGSQTENPHRFTNSDGVELGNLVLSGKTLYGTASVGGLTGGGTLFKLNTDGTGFTLLKTFPLPGPGTNHDAGAPGGLLLSGDTLYGQPSEDLSQNPGTVFSINLDGMAYNTLSPVANSDEKGPLTGLVSSGGALYGTTLYGGKEGGGIIFKVNRNGAEFSVLHRFAEKWRLSQISGAFTD